MLVEFRIVAESGGARLVVSECGLDAGEWNDTAKAAYAAEHSNGWKGLLLKLRAYTEGLFAEGLKGLLL